MRPAAWLGRAAADHPPVLDDDAADRAGELVALEGLALRVFLDHRQLAQLHPLEGREAGAAIGAEAAAADRAAIVGRPRIFHLGVIGAAERTAHLLLRLVTPAWASR